METPVWTQAMSVGEEHIDAQHQALFEVAANLLKALHEDQSEAALQEILAFLRRYTIRHFVTEESLLQDTYYPGLLEHKAVHANLITAFLDLEARALRSGIRAEAPALKAFIVRILTHIQSDDACYAPYFLPTEVLPRPKAETAGMFSMGIPSLDGDHASFLAILDRLQDALNEGRGDAELPYLLETLLTYAQQHFRREELLMELVDYPARADHAGAHAALLRSLEGLTHRNRQGEVGLALEASAFLKTWLREHIGSKDLAMVPYLENLRRI